MKAIFFDIDGTLVSFKTHKVPQSTKDAIKTLRSKGIKVFVATGRMLAMTSVLDDIEFDGYIAYNGAYCVDAQKNVIFKSPIPKSELEALANHLEQDKFPVSFMCTQQMYVNYINDNVLEVASYVNVKPPIVRPVRDIISEDVFQLCIYVDDVKLKEVLDNVLLDCMGSRWIPIFADVNIKGMNKQAGIDKVLEHFNIPLEQTMAFGDGGNDIPMLKHVACGIAMGNSDDRVKQASHYITETVDNDGIVLALKHFNLI